MADYGTATAGASIKPASLQSSIDAFDPVLSRLEEIATRATNCGDRITGSRPAEVEGRPESPSPNHLIFAIQARRERLVRIVDRIDSEMKRLESGIN